MTDQPRPKGELILYRTANDAVRVEVLYESETFWLDQRRMAELFGVDLRTVSEHLRNIYGSGELSEEATLRKIRSVRVEGNREVRRETQTLREICAQGELDEEATCKPFLQVGTEGLALGPRSEFQAKGDE